MQKHDEVLGLRVSILHLTLVAMQVHRQLGGVEEVATVLGAALADLVLAVIGHLCAGLGLDHAWAHRIRRFRAAASVGLRLCCAKSTKVRLKLLIHFPSSGSIKRSSKVIFPTSDKSQISVPPSLRNDPVMYARRRSRR